MLDKMKRQSPGFINNILHIIFYVRCGPSIFKEFDRKEQLLIPTYNFHHLPQFNLFSHWLIKILLKQDSRRSLYDTEFMNTFCVPHTLSGILY